MNDSKKQTQTPQSGNSSQSGGPTSKRQAAPAKDQQNDWLNDDPVADNKKAEVPAPATPPAPTVTQSNAVATASAPPPPSIHEKNPFNFEAFAGAGQEKLRGEDKRSRLLRICQPLTPQGMKGNELHIDGLQTGCIFDAVTGAFWPEETGLTIIPAIVIPEWVEWIPKNADGSGGGFVGIHPNESINPRNYEKGEKGGLLTKDNTELVKTYNIYCVISDPEHPDEVHVAVIPMAKGQLKVARAWNDTLSMQFGRNAKGELYQLPFFAQAWQIKTKWGKSNAGKPYLVYDTKYLGTVDQVVEPIGYAAQLYNCAQMLHKSVLLGEEKVRQDMIDAMRRAGDDEDTDFDFGANSPDGEGGGDAGNVYETTAVRDGGSQAAGASSGGGSQDDPFA